MRFLLVTMWAVLAGHGVANAGSAGSAAGAAQGVSCKYDADRHQGDDNGEDEERYKEYLHGSPGCLPGRFSSTERIADNPLIGQRGSPL